MNQGQLQGGIVRTGNERCCHQHPRDQGWRRPDVSPHLARHPAAAAWSRISNVGGWIWLSGGTEHFELVFAHPTCRPLLYTRMP